jgi:hypothetical protein
MIALMLKGTREVVLRRVQPISVHGQVSLDLYFSDPDDPGGPVSVARIGPEVAPRRLEPGDRLRLEYVVGQVIGVSRIEE